MRKIFMLTAILAVTASGGAMAGDIKAGEKVFKKCKACHVVDAEKNKTGPHLVNIFGRNAGSLESYKKYSKAMKESGIVWNEETLDGYLEKPKKYVKGTKMAFAGLKKEEDRDNVIAYLKSFSE
jgi:cytochrome c